MDFPKKNLHNCNICCSKINLITENNSLVATDICHEKFVSNSLATPSQGKKDKSTSARCSQIIGLESINSSLLSYFCKAPVLPVPA